MTEIRKEPTGSMKPMPPFQTLEEEAEYWDTHSPVDEVDKHTAVAIHRGQKTETLTIRFDPQDLAKLREQADERGMGPTTLVRMWCSSTSAATTRADTGTQVPRSRAREHGRRRRPVFGGSETLLFCGPEENAS